MRVKCDGQYLSYILEDNSMFFPTGYRVLKKQEKNGFISCMKNYFNGHIKLLYPISGYETVSVAAGYWGLKEVLEWMFRILQVLMEIQGNGFIQIETVDVELSHIFIEQENKRVWIVALPLNIETNRNSRMQWEQELRKSLLSVTELSCISDQQGILLELQQKIREAATLEDLYQTLKRIADEQKLGIDTKKLLVDERKEIQKEQVSVSGRLYIISRSGSEKVEIPIDKDNFVLGKNPALADGVLRMSPTISRKHCRIFRDVDGHYLEDLESKNFTYLNGIRLLPGEKKKLQHGDQIRLAEVEFVAEYR